MLNFISKAVGRYGFVALLVAFAFSVGLASSHARAQRSDLPQRTAPQQQNGMPSPQGPIATWTMNIGADTVGRVQVDIVGLCRAAINAGVVR